MRRLRETDMKFDLRRKLRASAVCGLALLAGFLLKFLFPMEFYSLLLRSVIGSNLLLLFLAAVLSVPSCLLVSKISGKNVSFTLSLISDLICTLLSVYIFSIFRYSANWSWLLVAALLFHTAVSVLIIGFPYEEEDVKLSYIKRSPIIVLLLSAVHTALTDGLCILAVYSLSQTIAESMYD